MAFVAERSDNFVIGLTNVSPLVTEPTLWNYDVCGQWPGAVGLAETVYLKCGCNNFSTIGQLSNVPQTHVMKPQLHAKCEP